MEANDYMNELADQLAKVQDFQNKLTKTEYKATYKGIEVTVNGKQKLLRLKLITPNDIKKTSVEEFLEITLQAIQNAQENAEKRVIKELANSFLADTESEKETTTGKTHKKPLNT